PLDRGADVRRDVLERELGRVHADDLEAVLVVGGIPRLQVRQRPQAVDARIGPEVDEHDLAVERRDRQWLGVDPVAVGLEVRGPPEVLQRATGRSLRASLAAAKLRYRAWRGLARL